MKLGVKISAGFLVVVFLMFVSGGISIYLLKEIRESSNRIQDEKLPLLVKTNQLAIHSGLKVAAMRGFVITGNDSYVTDYEKLEKEDAAILRELTEKSVTAQGRQLAQEIKTLGAAYQKLAIDKVIPAKREGKGNEVIAALMANELAPAAAATRAKIDEYVKFREKQINGILDNDQDQIDKAQWITEVFLGIALVCAGVIAFYITRVITRPIKQVTLDIGEMAKGNFGFRVPAHFLAGKDEIGDMARAMDKMLATMRETIRMLADSSELLASSSEELTASVEQSAQASNQVAQSIIDVAAGAADQTKAAKDTSAVVENISASLQQVAANTNQVADQAVQATDKAKAGGRSVEEAVKQMIQIEATVNTSAVVIAKLGERSKEIGQIVDTISGIAGQTNLLALNAAIEAARAGEQGRGFAVVADEVRKLAEQSQEAAKKIAELIGEIQADTDKAVVAMNDGTREVKTGADVVNSAGLAFQQITELVTRVSGQVKEISAAIQQVAGGSQQIVGSVKRIDELSKKSAAESQSVSAATEQQLASTQQIAGSSQALAQMAQELQEVVAKFRIA